MIVALHSVKAFFFIMAAHCTCKCICCGFGATRFVVDETTRAAAVAARVQKVALRRKEKLGWHKEGYAAQAAGFLRSTQKYVGRICSPTLPRRTCSTSRRVFHSDYLDCNKGWRIPLFIQISALFTCLMAAIALISNSKSAAET